MRTVWDVIKSPVITEKALVAKEETQDRRQLLTFRVDRRATKPEIKKAVESIFQVKVDAVRTANYLGKMARRGRHEGRAAPRRRLPGAIAHAAFRLRVRADHRGGDRWRSRRQTAWRDRAEHPPDARRRRQSTQGSAPRRPLEF